MREFNFFNNLDTQWKVSEGRKIGLDYTAVEAYMRMCQIPRSERKELIGAVQVMEFTVLDEWAQR